MSNFSFEHLERTLSDEARLAIADLILAWATMDMMISYWLILAFGMPLDTGSILVGNMDNRTKLEKIKSGFAHYSNKKSAASVDRLLKEHAKFVDVRNVIAHRGCVGCLKTDSERLVFSSTKRIPGEVGQFEVLAIHLSQIRAATKFATGAHKSIFKITETPSNVS